MCTKKSEDSTKIFLQGKEIDINELDQLIKDSRSEITNADFQSLIDDTKEAQLIAINKQEINRSSAFNVFNYLCCGFIILKFGDIDFIKESVGYGLLIISGLGMLETAYCYMKTRRAIKSNEITLRILSKYR